ACGVVNRYVVVRLKEAHLSYLLSPDTRGSYICDRARCKLYTCVCGVNAIRQNRNPYGAHVRHFNIFADKPLNDVEIVNHKIEHDIYIERARGEFAHSMNLEIERTFNVRAKCRERRVEPFKMSYL